MAHSAFIHGSLRHAFRAKFYQLTWTRRSHLEAESDAWRRLTVAVRLVIDMR